MAKKLEWHIKDLIPDGRNANKHSEYGMQQLEKGMRQNGLGRSILISSDNEIIAGNGVTETAGALGIEKVRVIETDGTEIIAVRRTDIKAGSKEFFQMALSDNIIASQNIVMDAEVTNAICEEYEIEDWTVEDNQVNYSDKNKEIDIDALDTEMIIKLKYTEDDYHLVKGQLAKLGQTPEQAVWQLLGNQ